MEHPSPKGTVPLFSESPSGAESLKNGTSPDFGQTELRLAFAQNESIFSVNARKTKLSLTLSKVTTLPSRDDVEGCNEQLALCSLRLRSPRLRRDSLRSD